MLPPLGNAVWSALSSCLSLYFSLPPALPPPAVRGRCLLLLPRFSPFYGYLLVATFLARGVGDVKESSTISNLTVIVVKVLAH